MFSELLRSFQSLSLMKARPAFWPWPLKEKPLTVKTESTAAFSSLRKWSRTTSNAFCVRGKVPPGGAWTNANIVPWSSSGRKPPGRRMKIRPMAATIIR